MRITDVTTDDGKKCATLINLIKQGRWDLSGADAEMLVDVRKWIQSLAVQMAEQLRSKQSPQEMRVTSMGTLPVSGTKKSKKK